MNPTIREINRKQNNKQLILPPHQREATKIFNIMATYYAESHEYVRVEGEYGYIGISDHAQHELGTIVYVDVPEVDDELEAGSDFGAVESVKAASDLIAPVSGVVVEVNEALDDEPGLLNKDAAANWIVKVKLSDTSELEKLMTEEDYLASIAK